MPPSVEPSATAYQRRVLLIAVLASSIAFLDGTLVSVALPAIVDEVGGGLRTQQWTVDSYLLTLGSFILIAGSASDAFGRRRVLAIGIVGFGLASLAVAAAPSAAVLIAARLVQGAAGALLVPSSLALITSAYQGARRATAIGTWTAATSGAMVAGPLIGGAFVDLASWRWAFVINVVPVVVVLGLLRGLGPRVERDSATSPHVDIVSAVLCALGLGGAVWALIEQQSFGWSSVAIWAPGIAGVTIFAVFLMRQARIERPMMPPGLFKERNFAWGNASTFFVYAALGLVSLVIAVFLQEHAGYGATAAGLASLPVMLIMIALSSRVGAWSARVGSRLFMTGGPLLMALGSVALLRVEQPVSYWGDVLPGIVLMGLGLTATVTPLTATVLGAVDESRAGIASAVNNAIARVAGLIAVASLGAIAGGALDLDGFHRVAIAMAAMLVVGGAVSWVGIRNPAPDAADHR